MKMFLSDRDFNKIWRYFDKDANGKIKSSEFVDILKKQVNKFIKTHNLGKKLKFSDE